MDALFEQLSQGAQQIADLVRDVPGETLRRKSGTEWAALEVLGHVRDRERLFSERITLFLNAEPFIPNWDEHVAAADGHYLHEVPQTTVAEFQELRQRNIQRLAAATEVWDHVAQHEVQGPYTLRREAERVVAHDADHLHQIATLLAL